MSPSCFNNFEVRLAESAADLDAAQELRYRVFYEDMGARPTPEIWARRRDFDVFDDFCDHLLVIDRAGDRPRVVGTYRLMRRSVARRYRGFYSEAEYDLNGLWNYGGEVMELGRSCVDPDCRSRGVMQLLWRGIADYIAVHKVGLMFGCASFSGIDPQAVAPGLSYLYHHRLAPMAWRPRALARRYVDMRILPAGHPALALGLDTLPPLIKGYMRLGGVVGDGAVVDAQFNTVDVCVVVETAQVTRRYQRHYVPGVVHEGAVA